VFPQHIADALKENEDEVFAGKSFVGKERNLNGRYFLTNCVPLISEQSDVTGAVIASRDITTLKENEEAVRRSEALLQRAQRLAKIGNWRLNTSTGQLEWSDETFRIFGRKPSEGMPTIEAYYQYLPEEDRPKAHKTIQVAIAHGQPYDVDHTIICRDGQVVYVHQRREHAEVASDGTVYLYGTIQDISERKRLEIQLNERNSRLETAVQHAREANQARELFIANITHELRTPLNTIVGFAQLLELEEMSQEKMHDPEYVNTLIDALRRIRNASKLLDDLFSELIMMASARDNPESVHIDWKDVPIVTLVREACSMVMPQTREHSVSLNIDVPPVEVRPYVRADERKLQQIMLNLLTNAIKYNKHRGNVQVRVSCHGDQVRVAVTDTGLGIAVEQQERIFTPFERLGIQGTEIPGRGLGLALANTYAQAMQTEITVESNPGSGSCFALLLQRVVVADD
jgi:PAS domain S-box-containing protein